MLTVLTLILAITLYCYKVAFYVPPRKPLPEDFIDVPPGAVYEPFHPQMRAWALENKKRKQEHFSIQSFDGLTLWGTYYEYAPGAPVELMFHGYRGNAQRDLPGGEALPPNVIGILADCGYSSQKEIQLKVAKEMGFPAKLCYPFIRLAARVFGGFDLEETTPLEALKRVKVPVIFFHGQADGFVPCHMSRAMYEACPGKKDIYTVPGADHGLAYPVDMDGYVARLREFFGPDASAD
jgi:hypothetical protein